MKYILFSLLLLPCLLFATQDPLIVEVDTAINILNNKQQAYQQQLNQLDQNNNSNPFKSFTDYPGLSAVQSALVAPNQQKEKRQQIINQININQNKINKLRIIKMRLVATNGERNAVSVPNR